MEMVLKFTNRDLESHSGLYKAFDHVVDYHIVNINGFEQVFKVLHTEARLDGLHYDQFVSVTLQSVEKTKSKQEVEAEEAVERAKQSLKSAKKVLESLKGL